MEPRQRVRLEDIARRVNVSLSTASRALAGDRRISLATREAVLAAAAELHYVPNQVARSLRMRRTRALGLLIPDLRDPVHGMVASTFEQAAGEHGYCVIMVAGQNQVARERLALKVFAEHGTDGVAIVSSIISPKEAHQRADPDRLIFVQPDHPSLWRPDGPLPAGVIQTDDAGGIQAAVSHLVDLGYRRLAYVGSGTQATNAARSEAFATATHAHGISGQARAYRGAIDVWRTPGALAAEIAADRPDALVCYDDKLALALMDALRSAGVRCPQDIGIVGFDGIPFAGFANPRLSTVATPAAELGRLAAVSLITTIQTGELPHAVLVPVQFVGAESTRAIPSPASRTNASA